MNSFLWICFQLGFVSYVSHCRSLRVFVSFYSDCFFLFSLFLIRNYNIFCFDRVWRPTHKKHFRHQIPKQILLLFFNLNFFFSNCFSLESALQVQMVKRLDNWIEMKDGKETKFVIFTQWRTHRRTKIHKIRNKGTHNNNEGNYFGVVSCPTWNKLKKNVVWQRQIYSRDCKPVVLYNRKRRRARVAHCVCSWNFRFHSSHAGRCVRALLRLLNVNFRLN